MLFPTPRRRVEPGQHRLGKLAGRLADQVDRLSGDDRLLRIEPRAGNDVGREGMGAGGVERDVIQHGPVDLGLVVAVKRRQPDAVRADRQGKRREPRRRREIVRLPEPVDRQRVLPGPRRVPEAGNVTAAHVGEMAVPFGKRRRIGRRLLRQGLQISPQRGGVLGGKQFRRPRLVDEAIDAVGMLQAEAEQRHELRIGLGNQDVPLQVERHDEEPVELMHRRQLVAPRPQLVEKHLRRPLGASGPGGTGQDEKADRPGGGIGQQAAREFEQDRPPLFGIGNEPRAELRGHEGIRRGHPVAPLGLHRAKAAIEARLLVHRHGPRVGLAEDHRQGPGHFSV